MGEVGRLVESPRCPVSTRAGHLVNPLDCDQVARPTTLLRDDQGYEVELPGKTGTPPGTPAITISTFAVASG